jgi:hypothetical protein
MTPFAAVLNTKLKTGSQMFRFPQNVGIRIAISCTTLDAGANQKGGVIAATFRARAGRTTAGFTAE